MYIEISIEVEHFEEKDKKEKNKGMCVMLCFTQRIWKSA